MVLLTYNNNEHIEKNIDVFETYFNLFINNFNTWYVVADLNNPSEDSSLELLFKLINKFNILGYKFERKYNLLKIWK